MSKPPTRLNDPSRLSDPSRRRWLSLCASAGVLAPLVGSRIAAAAPAVDRRVQNRQELWHTYARNSATLIARYHVTRWSSLLVEPLVGDGTLALRAQQALVLRDDGFSGSVTRIDTAQASYAPIASQDEARRMQRATRPSLDWLSERLLRIFSDGAPDSLIERARVEVPKGRSPRLELRPPSDHPARRDLRGITLSLDPVGGAVVRLEIAHAQGDRIRFDLQDHRQGVNPRELAALLDP